MHELGIARSLLAAVQDNVPKGLDARVTDIYLKIGRLSSVADESLRFYWKVLASETICEDAELHFERVAARMACRDCGNMYDLAGDLEACPECGSWQVFIVSGDQFQLDYIEIERITEGVMP